MIDEIIEESRGGKKVFSKLNLLFFLDSYFLSSTGACRGMAFGSSNKPDLNAQGVTPDHRAPPYFNAPNNC